jgi:hypothetical protein
MCPASHWNKFSGSEEFMVKKFLFYTTLIFPLIMCALILEGFSWIRKWTHAYFDWVIMED